MENLITLNLKERGNYNLCYKVNNEEIIIELTEDEELELLRIITFILLTIKRGTNRSSLYKQISLIDSDEVLMSVANF
jgi:hypothetical protein